MSKYDNKAVNYEEESEKMIAFEDLVQSIAGLDADNSEEESAEIRRIAYLRSAIREKAGFTKVETEMKAEGFRALYVRNPVECVLKYCFLYNDKNDNKKGIREFNALWRNLAKEEINFIPVGRTIGAGNREYITLHDLREFILKASSSQERVVGAQTGQSTISFDTSLSKIDVLSANADEEFIEFYNRSRPDMSEARSSLRYYFIKYTYFFICNQILDFISTLKVFTEHTPKEYIKSVNEKYSHNDIWSIEEGIRIDYRFDTLLDIIDTNNGNNSSIQLDKTLISASLNHLPLMFSNYLKDGSTSSPLFLDGNGVKQPLSKLCEKTQIFKNDTPNDIDSHKDTITEVNSLTIEDFEGYPIDFKKLFHSLFEKIISKGETWDIDDDNGHRRNYAVPYEVDADFIKGIIDGKYDLSRSALLMFFASIEGALLDSTRLIRDSYALFDEYACINLTRLNSILVRSGYVCLPDNVRTETDEAIDAIYYKVFTEEYDSEIETPASLLSSLMGEFYEEYNYSPLPFDIAQISARTSTNRLIGRG